MSREGADGCECGYGSFEAALEWKDPHYNVSSSSKEAMVCVMLFSASTEFLDNVITKEIVKEVVSCLKIN